MSYQLFSLNNTSLPYEEWVKLGRPKRAVFKYKDYRVNGEEYYLTYVPADDTLFVSVEFDYFSMDALLKVGVDSAQRRLHVSHASCFVANEWGSVNGRLCPRSGWGANKVFKKALRFVGDDRVLDMISKAFFGYKDEEDDKRWTWSLPSRIHKVSQGFADEACEWSHKIANGDTFVNQAMPWRRVVTFFDRTSEMTAASTKIKAAFKGWQARHEHRHNPYTPLGRHLLLADFALINNDA